MRVQWDTGSTNSYRMGKEGKYDLKLAGPPPVQESSDEEEEDMKGWFVSLLEGQHFSLIICVKRMVASMLRKRAIASITHNNNNNNNNKVVFVALISYVRAPFFLSYSR